MPDMGGAPGRIYFTAICRYAERYRIEGDAFDWFLRWLRVLDDQFLKFAARKRREAEAKRRT